MNYSDSKFNQAREWIKNARKNDLTWETIIEGNSKGELDSFLERHRKEDFWDVLKEDWIELCKKQKENEEESSKLEIGPYIISSKDEENNFKVPTSPASMWVEYKDKLLKKDFKIQSIETMEKTTHKILNKLKISTIQEKPIKGLVIGNVQSGKTANMAALMSMAADRGWNVFIVLSGTIENLRIQTQQRLSNDLHSEYANINWEILDNVKVNNGKQPDQLYLDEKSNMRYLSVCLKNSKRLKNLLKWLNRDKGKKQLMKILLIDDEADQAGVNSASIDKKEKTAINKLITNIIYDHALSGDKTGYSFKAMNYIGYTATPYANVLNENPGDKNNPYTMFPDDFVAVLKSSDEYFGPQQIFGAEGFKGLNILNHIPSSEVVEIRNIEKGNISHLPNELLDSLYWFYCCVAFFRIFKIKKPVSFLIHTSQKIAAHNSMSDLITSYLQSVDHEIFINECYRVWIEQTKKLSIGSFYEEYKNYGGNDIYDYPSFNKIEDIIRELLSINIQNINIDEDNVLTYTKGVHLCVDNGSNNAHCGDEHFLRLAYPSKKDNLDFSTAFIVIGGATLSRGLTIEGLVSTYFLRTSRQADTLMQMGRWFGYRKHYELLPRIWITKDTHDKFEFLSNLDMSLKKYMENLDVNNQKPRYFGIKVMNTPKPSWMMITSKKKMQKAYHVDMNYTGAKNQTTTFLSDVNSLINNIKSTKKFIKKLDNISTIHQYRNAKVWENINYNDVFDYMQSLELPECSTFVNLEQMREWFDKLVKDGRMTHWNVVLSGKKTSNIVNLSGYKIGKVNRSKKIDNVKDNIINIGALRNPSDLYADINPEKITTELLKRLKAGDINEITEVRKELGLSTVSELIIYIIDKNSECEIGSRSMTNMNSEEDIVGIAINIPGGKINQNYAEALSVIPAKDPEEEGEKIEDE